MPVAEKKFNARRVFGTRKILAGGGFTPIVPQMLRGTNMSGGEYSTGGGVAQWPTNAAIDFFIAVGITLARIPIGWEGMQPMLGGTLDSGQVSEFNRVVNRFTAAGVKVVIDIHNYARRNFIGVGDFTNGSAVVTNYSGVLLPVGSVFKSYAVNGWPDGVTVQSVAGSSYTLSSAFTGTTATQQNATASVIIGETSNCTAAQFADFVTKVTSLIVGNPLVAFFDVMNEPYGVNLTTWFATQNTAIAAIRSAGFTGTIIAAADEFCRGDTMLANGKYAALKANVVDPGNNVAYSVHQYFDQYSQGASATCIVGGGTLLDTLIAQARTDGKKLFLGEFAWGPGDDCMASIAPTFIGKVEAAQDVFAGWTWFGCDSFRQYGNRSGRSFLYLEPLAQGGSDLPPLALLRDKYFKTLGVPYNLGALSIDNATVLQSAAIGTVIGNISDGYIGDVTYHTYKSTFSLVNSGGGLVTLNASNQLVVAAMLTVGTVNITVRETNPNCSNAGGYRDTVIPITVQSAAGAAMAWGTAAVDKATSVVITGLQAGYSSGSPWPMVRAIPRGASTGKKYFKVTGDSSQGSAEVGLMPLTVDLTTTGANQLGDVGLAYRGNGDVVGAGGYRGGAADAMAYGSAIEFATDHDAKLFWVRVGGGNWNKNASANPATGVGGLTMNFAVSVGPAVSCWYTNFTADFTGNTAPSGFTGY